MIHWKQRMWFAVETMRHFSLHIKKKNDRERETVVISKHQYWLKGSQDSAFKRKSDFALIFAFANYCTLVTISWKFLRRAITIRWNETKMYLKMFNASVFSQKKKSDDKTPLVRLISEGYEVLYQKFLETMFYKTN